MAKFQVLYWQEIPSLLEVRDGDRVVRRQLSDRFQKLIDQSAMLQNLGGTDAYLEHWHKGRVEERSGNAETVVEELSAELEADFGRLKSDVMNRVRGKPVAS